MSYISWNAPFPLTISSNLNKSIVEKQLYAGKFPSFPTFVTINGNILSFLYNWEIKCRYSTADLCTQIYATMLIWSRCSLLTGQFAQWRGHGKSYYLLFNKLSLCPYMARKPSMSVILHDRYPAIYVNDQIWKCTADFLSLLVWRPFWKARQF